LCSLDDNLFAEADGEGGRAIAQALASNDGFALTSLSGMQLYPFAEVLGLTFRSAVSF
jgi:hypothetical protein